VGINFEWKEDNTMMNVRYYFPGILLILSALVIVVVPEILVAFIASLILMAGIGALYVGHRMRRSGVEIRQFENLFFEDDFFTKGSSTTPGFRCKRW